MLDIRFLVDILHKVAGPLHRDYLELNHAKIPAHALERFLNSASERSTKIFTNSLNRIKLQVIFCNDETIPLEGIYIKVLSDVDNMTHGLPFFSVVAGHYMNRQIKSAAISFPVLDEVYYATRDKDSWRASNNAAQRIRSAHSGENKSALIAVDYLSAASFNFIKSQHLDLSELRVIGSATYAGILVARGKMSRGYLSTTPVLATDALSLIIAGAKAQYHIQDIYYESNSYKIGIASPQVTVSY